MEGQARRALITGITGQDGSFLAELLLREGYRVTGIARGGAQRPLGCSEHLRGLIEIVEADLLAPERLREVVFEARPDELYHLAAPSFIPASWEHPAETVRSIVGPTAALLEAARDLGSGVRVFVAASGAIFGDTSESPQRETTPCRPTTPYAIAKLASHQLVGAMRAQYKLFACSGIVFNHESERRPEQFVTRTITRTAAQIKLGLAGELQLGDLKAVRDWSFAGDIMRGAWLALRHDRPDDYVLASGVGRTVADFAHAAFSHLGLDATQYVRVDPSLMRAREHTPSVGDPTRARKQLGWEPRVSFQQLVERMVQADLQAAQALVNRA